METEKLCDECKKKGCSQRVAGGVCSLNPKLADFIRVFQTRDPILIAGQMAEIVESENSRYLQALKHEEIGKEEEFITKGEEGDPIIVKRKKRLDNKISTLAFNIIKESKTLSDIVNPPKANPFVQSNTQYNISVGAVNEINALPEKEKKNVIKFIDNKLDNGRKDD